jgi:hypothetical protein
MFLKLWDLSLETAVVISVVVFRTEAMLLALNCYGLLLNLTVGVGVRLWQFGGGCVGPHRSGIPQKLGFQNFCRTYFACIGGWIV